MNEHTQFKVDTSETLKDAAPKLYVAAVLAKAVLDELIDPDMGVQAGAVYLRVRQAELALRNAIDDAQGIGK